MNLLTDIISIHNIFALPFIIIKLFILNNILYRYLYEIMYILLQTYDLINNKIESMTQLNICAF